MTKARTLADNFAADINGITAGTGITGGGTSGTVTITNDMATTIAAKGDLVAGTANDAYAALAVGANNTVLTADSSTATGLKWATPSSGGMTQISTGSLSGAQVDITSIPGTYIHLQLIIENLRPATDGQTPRIRVNANSTSVYFDGQIGFGGSFTASDYVSITTNGIDNGASNGLIVGDFYRYSGGTWKVFTFQTINNDETTPANFDFRYQTGVTNQTSAITEINLYMSSGNFTSGTWTLYGVK